MRLRKVERGVAFVVLLLGFSLLRCRTNETVQMPNVLLIVSEDHSPHLSCYGDTVILTPNIDQIAKEGLLFRNAYVTQSVCSPSRSSILTGLYPHQSGHFGLATLGYRFVGDVTNIYSLMKNRGYRTGMIGKLHLNPADSFPIDFHPIRESNFKKEGLQRYAEFAHSFMSESEQPFFLMVNFPDAHYPFQDVVEGKPAKPVRPDEVVTFPYIGFDNERIRAITASYYNCILRLDESIGDLMAALGRSGKKQETLVIYLSDHGDEMARGKFDIQEVSTKVPFIASWPGRIEGGTVSDALISTIDIVPTLMDVAGGEIPERATGKSLKPLFENPGADFRSYLFTEYNCDPVLYFPGRAVRDHKYKLIYHLLPGRKNPTAVYYTENSTPAFEGCPTADELRTAPDSIRRLYETWINPPQIRLFDLESDPMEFRDLGADPRFSEVRERLLARLQQWQVDTDDPFRHPEKLRALTEEHDRLGKWDRNYTWHYPEYLYGEKKLTSAH